MSKERFYYLIYGLFALEVGALAWHYDRLLTAPVIYWVLVGLAAFRASRTVTYNAIGRPLRSRWTVEAPDGSGAGDTVNPRPGSGLGELLACPICTGTHAAALLLAVYGLAPALGLALAALLGVAGISEVLNWAACLLEWQSHKAREELGEAIELRGRYQAERWREWNNHIVQEQQLGKVEERQ